MAPTWIDLVALEARLAGLTLTGMVAAGVLAGLAAASAWLLLVAAAFGFGIACGALMGAPVPRLASGARALLIATARIALERTLVR